MVLASQFPVDIVAQEAELAAMLADMGGWDLTCIHVKETCQRYAITHLKENPGLSPSDLQSGLQYFREGYLQCLDDNGR